MFRHKINIYYSSSLDGNHQKDHTVGGSSIIMMSRCQDLMKIQDCQIFGLPLTPLPRITDPTPAGHRPPWESAAASEGRPSTPAPPAILDRGPEMSGGV